MQNTELAFAESAAQLLEKLSIDDQVVLNAKFPGHQNHGNRKRVSAIKMLCYHVAKALDSRTLMTAYNLEDDDTKDSLIDHVSGQFKLYQLLKNPFCSLKPNLERKTETLLLQLYIWITLCRNVSY